MALPSLADELLRRAARAALAEPLARVLGRRRQTGVDAALDPQVAAILELQRLLRLPALDTMTPARARRFAEGGLSPLDVDPLPLERVVDIVAGGRPARVFEPAVAAGRSPHVIVYFHGGGGVIGSIRGSEPVTRWLAVRVGCTVISVEYRLGPEHRHPAAIDDAYAAYAALLARVPPGARVAVAGDSFGGYLATYVDHLAGERGIRRPDVQALIYPLVDQTLTSPSIDRHADGYLLTKSMIHYFQSHYLAPSDLAHRREISPRYWPDDRLRRAAPAIIATAGYDPLVDEADAHAAHLLALGVTVRHRRYPSLVHGFLSLAGAVQAARAATDEICDDIRAMLD